MKELITAERAPAMPQRNSIPEAAVKTEKAPLCLPEWKDSGDLLIPYGTAAGEAHYHLGLEPPISAPW